MLRAIDDLRKRGVTVGKESLVAELRAAPHGFDMPNDTTNHLILLSWLRKAGVLPARSYVFDDGRVRELTGGIGVGTIKEWEDLERPQQAFIKTLRRMAEVSGLEEVWTKTVRSQAELEHGDVFAGGQMAAGVISPLVSDGWITHSGATGAKGSKSGRVAPTQKLLDLDLELLTGFTPPALPRDIRKRINTPLEQIRVDLQAVTASGDVDKYKRGFALELLAVRLVRDLGLSPTAFRKRSAKTGGAEVDLIAEGAHLHFSRWLVQCKNVDGRVDLNALAKEVGLAVMLKAQVVLIVSTSGFKSSVIHYAERTSETTAIQVVLVGASTVDSYLRSGADGLREYFHDAAVETMRLKRPQVSDLEDED